MREDPLADTGGMTQDTCSPGSNHTDVLCSMITWEKRLPSGTPGVKSKVNGTLWFSSGHCSWHGALGPWTPGLYLACVSFVIILQMIF